MINIISYILFFFGNFLFILFIPDIKVQSFLYIYTLSSLIVGPISFIFFSRFLNQYNKIKILILILSLLIIFYNNNYLYFVYTLNIFFSDLFSSQIKGKKINFIFKSLLFLSVIPLIFNFFSFEFTLLLRIILCIGLIVLLLIIKPLYIKLDIVNPLLYQTITNINYYGSLFILTLILEKFTLKITYITFQIGFSIILKYYDLRIRNIIDNQKFKNNLKYVVLIIFSLPLIFFITNPFLFVFILYYLSIIFFFLMKYKFLNKND